MDTVETDRMLREREAQYRSVFEATTDGLVIHNSQGTIVEINPAYCRMLGYDRDELIGKHVSILIPSEHHHLIAEGMESIGTQETPRARVVVLRKDGTRLHVEGHGVAFLLNGETHYLGVTRDITDQLQAEQQLREREQQYRSIFEATTDGLGIVDAEGNLVEVNPAYCRLLGYSYDELLGMPATKLMHPDQRHLIAEGTQTILGEGGSVNNRAILVRKDGTLLHVDGGGTAFAYRGEPHILGVVRDITDGVHAEEQLRERERQYQSIFESSADGLAIYDQRGFLVEANPAYCHMLGYTPDELVGMHATATVHPDFHHVIAEGLERVNRDVPFRAEVRLVRKDGTSFPADGGATTFTYHGTPHDLVILRDISERVEAEKLLEQRVAERTRELSTLLDVSYNVSSTLELRPLMDVILDQLEDVVEYAGASISLIEGDESRIVAFRGAGSASVALDVRFPLKQSALFQLWRGSAPLIIDDVRQDDTPEAAAFRRDDAAMMDESFSYVRSWMAVPMVVNERLLGVLTLNGAEPGLFTHHHAELVLAIAQQAAIAIENARLYEQTVERTRELSALLDVSRNVASTLELKPLLSLILDQLNLVADNDGIALLEVRGDEFVVLLRRAPGLEDQEFPARYSTQSHGPIWDRLRRGKVTIIGDVRAEDPLARAYENIVGGFLNTSLSFERSFMAVPLMLKDRIIGLLGLTSSRPHYYTTHHAELALAIAQQAAIAMENARLFERAQEVAALEERQRLARELHDSVSQALYGISLGAQTARGMIERDPAKAIDPLDYVVSLAQTGLAEMRALILELRPESLETEGLVAVLQKQAMAVGGRYQIRVTTDLGGEPEAPIGVKQAFYRIAQEALHNAIKHADAREVQLSLACAEGDIILEIQDDGAGFDADSSYPGHVGLESMRERARGIGGSLQITSSPGAGTLIRACIPRAPVKSH
jgi:PAS domain S-box-containing protein